jgi:hypothetical protein
MGWMREIHALRRRCLLVVVLVLVLVSSEVFEYEHEDDDKDEGWRGLFKGLLTPAECAGAGL